MVYLWVLGRGEGEGGVRKLVFGLDLGQIGLGFCG